MIPYLIIFTVLAAIAVVAFSDKRSDADRQLYLPVFMRLSSQLPKGEIQKLYCLNEVSKDEYEYLVSEKYGLPI